MSEPVLRLNGMTTPVPQNPSSTTAIPAGPLRLGDLFSATWAVYKQRFGLLVTLMVIPTLLLIGSMGVIAVGATAIGLAGDNAGASAAAAMLSVLVAMAVLIAVTLYQYRVSGMVSLVALDVADGRPSTWGNLHERTRGMMMRLLAFIVLVYVAVTVVVGVVLFLALLPFLSGNSDAGAAAILVLLLLYLVMIPIAIFLGTRWLYFLRIMANEGVTGFEAIKRSWRMTKGAFWRTFGASFVASLVVSIPASIATRPLSLSESDPYGSSTASLPALLLALALLAVVMIVLAPFMQVWIGLMYLSRGRELIGQPTAATSWGAAPGYPQAPQQGYPQAPQQGPQNPWDSNPNTH